MVPTQHCIMYCLMYRLMCTAGNYDEYFGMATDVEAVVYLMLVRGRSAAQQGRAGTGQDHGEGVELLATPGLRF